MRLPGMLQLFRIRLWHPGRLTALLALGALWALVRLLLDVPYGRLGYGEALIPFFLVLGSITLAPMAWQWGGDGDMAPGWRGLTQSLVWNGLWVAGLLGAMRLLGGGQAPLRPPPPAREGPPPPMGSAFREALSLQEGPPRREGPRPHAGPPPRGARPPREGVPPRRDGSPPEGQPPPRDGHPPHGSLRADDVPPPRPAWRAPETAPSAVAPQPREVSSEPAGPSATGKAAPQASGPLGGESPPDRPQPRLELRNEPVLSPPPPHPRGPTGRPPSPPFPPELFHLGLGVLLATLVGRGIAEREAGENREAQLLLQTEKAQALALQSQMQPHALFNALSGLVELAHDDPEATEAALVALCDYLRRLMAHAARESAPLRAERELLEDYLRIEQIRLGERLRVGWDWPDWADKVPVLPLLLQPLVENAILHGIAVAPEGGELRIAVHRTDGQLVLKVENTGRAPEGEREGLGLGHLRERLRLWRGGRGRLELVREGDWTRARLTLPLAD